MMNRKLQLILFGLLALGAVPALAEGQGPHVRLVWILKKAEIQVRESLEGRYIVEAFLDLDPPPEAHPQVDPGPFEIWYHGDKNRQALQLLTARINGKETVQPVISLEAKGTRILLNIGPENRVAPLSIQLVVSLLPEKGRVAMPFYTRQQGAEVTLVMPDGKPRKVDAMPRSVVVDEREASAGDLPVIGIVVAACLLLCLIILLLVMKFRTAGGDQAGRS